MEWSESPALIAVRETISAKRKRAVWSLRGCLCCFMCFSFLVGNGE